MTGCNVPYTDVLMYQRSSAPGNKCASFEPHVFYMLPKLLEGKSNRMESNSGRVGNLPLGNSRCTHNGGHGQHQGCGNVLFHAANHG